MTNKMIDADILSEKLRELASFIKDAYTDESYKVVELKDAIQAIYELATPEPKESVDADGWCFDFNKFKDYYSEYGFLIKTDTSYTTIKCGEQYRLCLKGVIAWRPLPTPPAGGNE
jgi:hypothetical protein